MSASFGAISETGSVFPEAPLNEALDLVQFVGIPIEQAAPRADNLEGEDRICSVQQYGVDPRGIDGSNEVKSEVEEILVRELIAGLNRAVEV